MPTTQGAVDQALYYILAFSVLLFVAIVFFMVYFLVRYRRSRNPRPTEIHGNFWFEVGALVVPTLLSLTFFWIATESYAFLRRVPQGALEIKVHSRQFAWTFEYPDGSLVPQAVVPQGSDVHFVVTSDDVLHGFYVPAMRIQIDAVPGQTTYAWMRAAEPGSYDVLCTVYCGTAHSAMLSKIFVVPVADYEAWKKGGELRFDGSSLPLVKPEGGQLLSLFGCLNCHSTDGTAGVGPTFKGLYGSTVSLRGTEGRKTLVVDEAYLVRAITRPHDEIVEDFQDLMPDPGDKMSAEDVQDLVKTIVGLK